MSVLVNYNENRRLPRYPLRLSIRVEVISGRKVTWEEVADIKDASVVGAAMILKRPIKRGRIVRLGLEMPGHMRRYDLDTELYVVWGIVRRSVSVPDPVGGHGYATGIAFTGQCPPQNFFEHPARIYNISYADSTPGEFWEVVDPAAKLQDGSNRGEYRKETRLPIPEELVLEVLDESGEIVSSEVSVTANISYGGATVFTEFYAEVGTFLRVISRRLDLEIIAIVRHRRPGPGDSAKLNIEFVDKVFPLEGII
jgi:hypothetical protein